MNNMARWAGRAISTLVALALIVDGAMGLLRPDLFGPMMAADGWPERTLLPVSLLALASGVLLAIPRTAVLGAIAVTGFVGGGLATHLRVTGDVIPPEIALVLLGLGAWGGLHLRDARMRTLLPLRS